MDYPTTILALMAVGLLTSCGSDDMTRPVKDWDNTTSYFESTDASHYETFYKPAVGYVGDPMPFYDPVEKDFKIMYLQEFRPNSATYHPIWGLRTRDGASYESMGELIPTGTVAEMDGAIGTGSTVYNEADGTYYTFYTGHSADISLTGIGEAVLLATSKDFRTWTKERSFIISPEGEYSTSDFRDPFVFKGDDNMFHMVVSTQKDGKGVLAEYTSTDLRDWKSQGVFMTMMWDRFYECPDIFRMGDWWYLVYSEKHAAVRKVQYFKGRTLSELKACTADDAAVWPDMREGMLDSRGFYAGKTASDGTDRYIWGWCPTRPGNDNTNAGAYPAEPEWAGALVAHRLIQNADGTLSLGPVKGITDKFGAYRAAGTLMAQAGDVNATHDGWSLGTGSHILFSRLGYSNMITFKVSANTGARFGISFARGEDSAKYYSVIFNPEGEGRMKLNFEEEGDAGTGFINGADSNIFAAPADGTYDVTVLTDNSVVTIYVNDDIAYTTRIYGLQKNCWSFNSYSGGVTLSALRVNSD